ALELLDALAAARAEAERWKTTALEWLDELTTARAEAERWKARYEELRDALIVVHPTQNGHVRVLMSSDGPAETIMTPDEARVLARRLLWAVGQADAVRMRGLDDEVGVGLTDPGGDEVWRSSKSSSRPWPMRLRPGRSGTRLYRPARTDRKSVVQGRGVFLHTGIHRDSLTHHVRD